MLLFQLLYHFCTIRLSHLSKQAQLLFQSFIAYMRVQIHGHLKGRMTRYSLTLSLLCCFFEHFLLNQHISGYISESVFKFFCDQFISGFFNFIENLILCS